MEKDANGGSRFVQRLRDLRVVLGVIVAVGGVAVLIWQLYLPFAEPRGYFPYQSKHEVVNVGIIDAQFDAPGPDSKDNLNDEWVQIKNTGNTDVDVSGWRLFDYGEKHVYQFGEFILSAGETVKIHSGCGTDCQTDLYWGSGSPIWNNDGDTATLVDLNEVFVDDFSK